MKSTWNKIPIEIRGMLSNTIATELVGCGAEEPASVVERIINSARNNRELVYICEVVSQSPLITGREGWLFQWGKGKMHPYNEGEWIRPYAIWVSAEGEVLKGRKKIKNAGIEIPTTTTKY